MDTFRLGNHNHILPDPIVNIHVRVIINNNNHTPNSHPIPSAFEFESMKYSLSYTHFSFGGGGSISTALPPGLRGGVFSFSIIARGASGGGGNGLTVFVSMLLCRTFFNESRLI